MSGYTNTPTRFRSRFTGQQIDTLLSSIDRKIDLAYIVNDFVTGGSELVASAELAKTLYNRLQQFEDPNYIKSLILSVPNALVYTIADKLKLEQLAGFFRGSFANPAERNVAVNTFELVGGELTFLISDDNGAQEMSYWDKTTLTWKKSRFLPNPASETITNDIATNKVMITVDKTKFSQCKYIIRTGTSANAYSCELSVMVKGSNTFWSVSADMGDNPNLFTVTGVTLSGSYMNIMCQVAANSNTKFYRLAEF